MGHYLAMGGEAVCWQCINRTKKKSRKTRVENQLVWRMGEGDEEGEEEKSIRR